MGKSYSREEKYALYKSANLLTMVVFEKYLHKLGLSEPTIKKHLANIDLFINYFLLQFEILRPEHGISEVEYFFGEWYPGNIPDINKADIKAYIATLRKFFTHQARVGYLEGEDIAELNYIINEKKDSWLALVPDA